MRVVVVASTTEMKPVGSVMSIGSLFRNRTTMAMVLITLLSAAAPGCAPATAAGVSMTQEEQELPDVRSDEEESDPPEGGVSARGLIAHGAVSNETIMDLVRGFAYRGRGFQKVNEQPFASTVSPGKTVDLWISEASYDPFTEVSPDERGSHAELPVGTVIVREVLAHDELETITVMVKLPEGAFPLGGDFWYAAAGPDGTIRTDEKSGTPQAGLLENCGTCHLRRSDDAFVFGAPAP